MYTFQTVHHNIPSGNPDGTPCTPGNANTALLAKQYLNDITCFGIARSQSRRMKASNAASPSISMHHPTNVSNR